LTAEDGWQRFYGGLLQARRRGAYELSVLERLRRVRERLDAHPGEPIDLEAMARAACFSKFHFLRLFRQAYGETPARYLSQARLERARTLLETTDRSVTDICLAVGYESPASFTHSFRRYAGFPPRQYRRRWVAVPRPAGPALRLSGCFMAMYG
ncbi:MAG: helix-turn-helix transcriptional regulator, partial [Acidobacteriota bacterium]|nr:helix-turn-helix transcriptional regulator [Acidobacteriota bacterium]